MAKKAITVYFEVYSDIPLEGLEETTKHLQSDQRETCEPLVLKVGGNVFPKYVIVLYNLNFGEGYVKEGQ